MFADFDESGTEPTTIIVELVVALAPAAEPSPYN